MSRNTIVISVHVNDFLVFSFQMEAAQIWMDCGTQQQPMESGVGERSAAVQCQIRSLID